MKFTILKENFKNGLDIIERVVGRNLTLPILNNVLLAAEKNFLHLSATDLEVGINYWTFIKTEKEGQIASPARFLASFINSLPDKKINLEVKGEILYIDCENYKTQIISFNSEEFPIIPKIENENFIEISSLSFYKGLEQLVDIVNPTQARPEISGIYLLFEKNSVKMVATDSFRLAEKNLIFKGDDEQKISYCFPPGYQDYSLILPQKTARELINIFSPATAPAQEEKKLKIYFSQNQILFELPMTETAHPHIQVISRLVEGEYPNYQEIIPKKYQTQIILSRNDFLNQIKSASLFSGKINEIKLKIDSKKEGMEIFSQSPAVGESKSFLSGRVKGEKTETSFNYRFLVDGLSNIKTKEVVFELNDKEGPAVLKPLGDPSYIYVVMPIKSS